MTDVNKWEINWVPSSHSSAVEAAVETGPSASLQQNDNSSMPGMFILDKHGEMETKFPLCPPKQLLLCCLCCTGGAALSSGARGWCPTECEVNVQCFWNSDVEETICDRRWMMCLEMVCLYFIILPAGISLRLCFVNISCPFFLMVLGFWGGVGWCLVFGCWGFFLFPLLAMLWHGLASQISLGWLIQNGYLSLQAGEQLSSRPKIWLPP